MKQIVAIFTGDLLSYKNLSDQSRKKILSSLQSVFEIIIQSDQSNATYNLQKQIEIYRGDSFQGLIWNVANALDYVLLIKSFLRKSTPEEAQINWDARIALGIGKLEYPSEDVLKGDGTAYRNSGPYLDQMESEEGLIIVTPWKEVNDELRTECVLIDVILQKWTRSQAEVIAEAIPGANQNEIAQRLGISQSAVNQRLKAAHWNAVKTFIQRYKEIIKKNIQ